MATTSWWDSFTIRGFRGLADVTLDELGAFNVLLGANDVGKTSILESIFLLSGFANIGLPIQIQNGRNYFIANVGDLSSLFHRLHLDRPVELTALSSDPTERRVLRISAPYQPITVDTPSDDVGNGSHSRSSSSLPRRSRVLSYDATIYRDGEAPITSSGTLEDQGDKFTPTMTPDSVFSDIIPARFMKPGDHYDPDTFAQLVVNKNKDVVVRYLCSINPRVEDIAADGKAAYLDIGLSKMLPLNMFGSGMIRAASIISHCVIGDARFMLIDELENGLHYKAIPPLLEALLALSKDKGIQVFATTHSLGILKGLEQVLSKPRFAEYRPTTNCYALQRDSKGSVRGYRYGYDEYSHSVKHGLEIR